ncbi:MAG: AAA family ATPase [Microbacteriaceae bacterium]
MRIALLGGLRIEHDGRELSVSGAMARAVLFRLAVDAGRTVSYRELVEDVWGLDAPANERAALQSVVSRLRRQLPAGVLESAPGGYRLLLARADVDALVVADLVAAAERDGDGDAARAALDAWTGEPWTPSAGFDWFERDLHRDRRTAWRIAEAHPPAAARSPEPGGRALARIPAPLTGLIGREEELAAIAAQLERARLVTIVGPGGAGKTRLALEAAAQAGGAVLLVELAPVGPGEVAGAILTATGRELRVETGDARPSRERLLEALAGRRVLLVVDNCEHVIAEAAALLAELLPRLPGLRVLATSREPLGVPGEAFVSLGPLPHPAEAEIGRVRPAEFAVVALFRERAVAATGAPFEELDTAARICARLDGLPLAIELAAVRLRTMSAAEVLAGLDDRFALLSGGRRAGEARHHTLKAMIDWSWALLDAKERRALAWLAVYPAGVAVSEAAEVARAVGLDDAAVLETLVEKSLLVRSRGRYRALETIRGYGLERLAESGELEAARRGLVERLAAGAARADGRIRGPGIRESIAWFDAEEDNLALALRIAGRTPLPELAVELSVACAWYWFIRGRDEEFVGWFAEVLPAIRLLDTPEAGLLDIVGTIVAEADRREGAARHEPFAHPAEQPAEPLAGPLAGPPDTAVLLSRLDALPPYRGDHDLLALLPSLARQFVLVGDDRDRWAEMRPPRGEDLGLGPWPTALLHAFAAALAQNRGDVAELGEESELALARFARIGDPWGLAFARQLRSEWLKLHGRLTEALECADAAARAMARITPAWDLAQLQTAGIEILIRLGRLGEAGERAEELRAAAAEAGTTRAALPTALLLANVALHGGDPAAARELLAPLGALVEEFGRPAPQLLALMALAEARAALLEGRPEAADTALRRAAAAATASGDHPVMGEVAIVAGALAQARGELRSALHAIDVSAVLIGVRDETHPLVVAIDAAAAEHGIDRDGAVLSRPMAVAELERLA